ncbi:MAG: hypothetical protein RTU92_04605 [Candidatus Thorarchaeota archaeon]
MTETPVVIPYRPFSLDPRTQSMTPDGVFITNMGMQIIHATILNEHSAHLDNVKVYVEGLSDPNVVIVPEFKNVGRVPKGASFPVLFQANFSAAMPGKALMSFIIESNNHTYKRVLKEIYITRISYDENRNEIIVQTPQGNMHTNIGKAILGPEDRDCYKKSVPPVIIPLEVTYTWYPKYPYEGKRGDQPFKGSWGWLVKLAALAAMWLLCMLLDYLQDGDLDIDAMHVKVKGTIDEIEQDATCCETVEVSVKSEDMFEQFIYGVATGVTAVAVSSGDFPDLHWRGQDATPPRPGELTVYERVNIQTKYNEPPSPGHKYSVNTSWKYTRGTTGNTYEHEEQEVRVNDRHILSAYEVEAPSTHDRMEGPLRIKARFKRPDGRWFKGDELYVIAYLVSTDGKLKMLELVDHGMDLDEKANDTWFTGGYRFMYKPHQREMEDMPGYWYLYVAAQDVNTVLEDTPEQEALDTIGGWLLTPQFKVKIDGDCELSHDKVIHII